MSPRRRRREPGTITSASYESLRPLSRRAYAGLFSPGTPRRKRKGPYASGRRYKGVHPAAERYIQRWLLMSREDRVRDIEEDESILDLLTSVGTGPVLIETIMEAVERATNNDLAGLEDIDPDRPVMSQAAMTGLVGMGSASQIMGAWEYRRDYGDVISARGIQFLTMSKRDLRRRIQQVVDIQRDEESGKIKGWLPHQENAAAEYHTAETAHVMTPEDWKTLARENPEMARDILRHAEIAMHVEEISTMSVSREEKRERLRPAIAALPGYPNRVRRSLYRIRAVNESASLGAMSGLQNAVQAIRAGSTLEAILKSVRSAVNGTVGGAASQYTALTFEKDYTDMKQLIADMQHGVVTIKSATLKQTLLNCKNVALLTEVGTAARAVRAALEKTKRTRVRGVSGAPGISYAIEQVDYNEVFRNLDSIIRICQGRGRARPGALPNAFSIQGRYRVGAAAVATPGEAIENIPKDSFGVAVTLRSKVPLSRDVVSKARNAAFAAAGTKVAEIIKSAMSESIEF